MKTRNGFVSNSSSASFVVHWRMRTMGKEVTTLGAMANLYDVHSYDSVEDKIDWDKNWTKEYKNTIEYVVKTSTKNSDGSFTTPFFATCLNVYDDFGEEAKSLVLALVADQYFEIIDAITQEDG